MGYLRLLSSFFRLRGNENATKTEMRRLQMKKLHELLSYVWENSPYYRGRFEEAGITEKRLFSLPLAAFPSIDKAEFLAHFDEIVTTPELSQERLRRFDAGEEGAQTVYKGKYHVVHSSGSTGKPAYFAYDDAAWDKILIAAVRGAFWGMSTFQIMKLLLGGPRITYLAATDGRYGGAMAVGDSGSGLRAKQLSLDIKTPLNEWVEKIRDFRTNILVGYPSAIKILGELMEEGGICPRIQRVICCGEPLSANLRRYLEHVFSAEVVNFYGAGESLALGVETGHTDGMVLFDDLNVIEVQDGDMYLTSLYNFAQPLIRYRLTDRLQLKTSRGPFTRAEILNGRSEDLLWFTDGGGGRDFLHPLAIEGFCVEGLLDFQFIKTGNADFVMLAEVSDPSRKEKIRSEILGLMNKILREKQLSYVRFSVRFVDRILPDPHTGKKKLVLTEEGSI